jgi:ubiquinone/menaquinone biosynthesis C-methylase UbiE
VGREIDLLRNYPKTKRNIDERLKTKSETSREIARKFGKDFFDGDREYGYGGFNYNPRYWTEVVADLINEYQLSNDSSVLDVGCAKGFFLHDLKIALPGINIKGIDISKYAIENCIGTVKNDLSVASADDLPFEDNSFDLVISINTVHNLDRANCGKALSEITRVTKQNSFITVDAYRNQEEKVRMEAWNLTAKTIMSCSEWVNFFSEIKYLGDYFWFTP